jgi:hypothetical protein
MSQRVTALKAPAARWSSFVTKRVVFVWEVKGPVQRPTASARGPHVSHVCVLSLLCCLACVVSSVLFVLAHRTLGCSLLSCKGFSVGESGDRRRHLPSVLRRHRGGGRSDWDDPRRLGLLGCVRRRRVGGWRACSLCLRERVNLHVLACRWTSCTRVSERCCCGRVFMRACACASVRLWACVYVCIFTCDWTGWHPAWLVVRRVLHEGSLNNSIPALHKQVSTLTGPTLHRRTHARPFARLRLERQHVGCVHLRPW